MNLKSLLWRYVLCCALLHLFALPLWAARIYVLTTGNQLRLIESAVPGTVLQTVTITGLQPGENVEGIDFRPATGEMFALGSSSRLYILNPSTGVATQIGSAGAFTLSGTSFGFDINPVADRIRVVSDSDQNLRLNPSTGALTATDTALSYSAGGANPTVVGCAYLNSVAGAATTTLYGIDSGLDILVIQNPPNGGILNSVGSLGVNASSVCGFDIWDFDNTAFAAMAAPGDVTSQLYTINLATGAATALGTIGGGVLVKDLAVVPVGSVRFSSAVYLAGEQSGHATITAIRVGGAYGGMTIGYATSAGTASAGVDYQPVSGVLTFADGETNKSFEVPVVVDEIPELNETVRLNLSVAPGDGLIAGQTSAVLQIVSSQGIPVYLLTVSNRIERFSTTPAQIETNFPVTGLEPNETLLAIDFRPATGQLYGLGNSNRLYVIDISSGAATPVGAPGSFTLSGLDFGFDFNPVADRIRVVSESNQDIRLNPSTGALTATDGALAFALGDVNQGADPNVVASAYTKNYAGATVTTLYGIDSSLDILVIQNPPNNGILNTVGNLGVEIGGVGGFDITEADQAAYAVFNRTGGLASEVYRINLSTGEASLLDAVGGNQAVRGMAIGEPTPNLKIQVSGTNTVLSWSAASAGFYLESTTNLNSTGWMSNAVLPSIVNDLKMATNVIQGSRFYRLKK